MILYVPLKKKKDKHRVYDQVYILLVVGWWSFRVSTTHEYYGDNWEIKRHLIGVKFETRYV